MVTQDTSAAGEDSESLILHTTDIVVSYVANNSIGAEEVSSLIRNIHTTLAGLGAEGMQEPRPDPAVSVRASVKNDHLVCLEDGRKFKTLKRHLMTDHRMTPHEYRARWDLSASYPMVAPDYSERRSEMARKIGLGRKLGERPKSKSHSKAQPKKAGAPRKTSRAGKRAAKPAKR